MDALNRLIPFIKQHALFLPEERVLLGVSGGRDSVLMAHLFNEAGFTFGIAHCNFDLRGEESVQDEAFTSNLAAELDVPFFTTTFETMEYMKLHHLSVQMAARDLRYQWLEEIRSDFGYQYIAVAHHQNDVMETMILNLTRGTGIAGLHGIMPKKDKIIRPLLFLTRDEITQIMDDKGFQYREDRSNESSKYARNKIRMEVIPVLKQLNPSLELTFEANRKRFEELEKVLYQRIEELKSDLFRETIPGEYEIALQGLKDLDPADTLLYGLFHPFGFSEAVLHDLRRSWNGEPGKVFSSLSYNLHLDRNKVILSRRNSCNAEPISVESAHGSFSWENKTFRAATIPVKELALRREATVAQLDLDLLTFPLILRKWNEGDSFQPLGLSGKKKLSDFFIEQKIPLSRKKRIGILENGNGDIIWVAGYRIDERYKITPHTKKVFIFEQYT